jgi:hypothetical protein
MHFNSLSSLQYQLHSLGLFMGANIKVLSPPLDSYPCFSSGVLVNDTIPIGLAVLFFSVVQYAPNFPIKDKLKHQVSFEWLSEEKKKKIFPTNSSPAIMPLAALYFGVIFLRGHISLKNGTFCPLSSHDTSSFNNMCLLIYLIEAKVALYGAHLHCELGQ